MIRKLSIAALAIAALGLVSAANATVFIYTADLDGPSEFPPNPSPGTGFAQVDYDDVAHTLTVQAIFQDLIGTTTMAHIHAPTLVPFAGTASVATQVPSFLNFPIGVTSGTMPATDFDLTQASSWNGAYITANGGTPAGAEAAFALALDEGRAYFNIHTTNTPAGEIRGFMELIPEPATVSLAALGVVGLLLARRARHRA